MFDDPIYILYGSIVLAILIIIITILFKRKPKELLISFWYNDKKELLYSIYQQDLHTFVVVNHPKIKTTEPAVFKSYYQAVDFIRVDSKSLNEIVQEKYFKSITNENLIK